MAHAIILTGPSFSRAHHSTGTGIFCPEPGTRLRIVMQSALADRGTKRTCLSCGERFYDLARDPITCPACEHVHSPSAFAKQRSAPVVVEVKAKSVVAAVATEGDEDIDLEVEDISIDDDDDDDDGLIPDDDNLGNDDAELAEVVVDIDENEEES
jgi:uncharacterized protein (TIGR02300 family)